MTEFRNFFHGTAPRADVNDDFPPNMAEPESPALVSGAAALSALAVAARLLDVLARRGATRIKSSDVEHLLDVARRALGDGSSALCDDEVLRILNWLENPPHDTQAAEIPELAVMHEADVADRIAALEYAQSQGLDVELQYYDLHRKTWPRTYGTVVRVQNIDDVPVLFLDQDGIVIEIECEQIRWVMPVSARNRPHKHRPADVLTFPFGKKPDA